MRKFGYLPLKEVITRYEPAYFDDWDTWFADKSPATTALVETLIKEFHTNGRFEEPVRVIGTVTYEKNDGSIEEFPPVVCNGMHRLLAHYRGNFDPVWVEYKSEETETAPEDKFDWVLFLKVKAAANFSDEDWEEVFETLSWRHLGSEITPWMSMEFGSGMDDIHTLWVSGGNPEEVHAHEVEIEIRERLAHFSFLEVLSVHWEDVSFDPEEQDEIVNTNPTLSV